MENKPTPTASTPQLHPIVDASERMLFGASRGNEWLPAEKTAELLTPGRTYRLYGLTAAMGTATGSGPKQAGETCVNPEIPFQDLPQHDLDLFAIGAEWNALPREPARLNIDQNVYREALAEHLRERGLDVGSVKINQLLRVDLEGDGVDEVLLVSNQSRGSPTSAFAGDYGVVLLRKVIDGKVHQLTIQKEYYTEDCIAECAPSTFRVAGILDVNGDGVMEVITAFRYFEGRGKRVHTVDGKQLRTVLSWRCGA